MYYKVKVWSAEDCTKKESYYIKETLPYVDRNCLEGFFKKVTDYQVSVVALPAHVTKLKKKFKVWDSFELQEHIRNLKFYTMNAHEVEEWSPIATFYKEKPFDIETCYYYNKWYSFFKNSGKYTTDIYKTLQEILDTFACSGIELHISKYGDPYITDKFNLSYDGYGHVHLNLFMGTHTEYTKEEIVL